MSSNKCIVADSSDEEEKILTGGSGDDDDLIYFFLTHFQFVGIRFIEFDSLINLVLPGISPLP